MIARRRSAAGYAGLVVFLVAAILAFVIAAVMWGHKQKPQQDKTNAPANAQTIPGQAVERGHEVECMSNLRSIRQAIEMHKVTEETPPPNLAALSSAGIGPQQLRCPVSGAPYQYDPSSGRVWCPTPGHEGF
ncbi:MAG: hypothetical protein ACUVTZ_11080 [Armatimonadota bacterium]